MLHVPDTGPGKRVPGAGARTEGREASRQSSEVGAVCRKAARTVLCGGRPVMGVPTAIDRILFPIILVAFCLRGGLLASADKLSFTVHFAGCTEFAGWGPVSLAEAQPVVPAGYVIAGAAMGQAAIV